MKILAFESSCDETAVAVVEDGRRVLSDAIASQADMHALYGGVVPEIASRKHVEAIAALTDKALADAGVTKRDIDAVAVTYAPGLIGAVLVGLSFAKSVAYALGVPLIPVHHIRGHIAANYLAFPELEPPFLALCMSGGNTLLVDVRDYTDLVLVGATRDDAAGECFRKYASVEDSYRDHSEFLDRSERYQDLFKLDPLDYKGWAYGLKQAGYATNPQYAELLIKIIEDNRLYLLDEGRDIDPQIMGNRPDKQALIAEEIPHAAPADIVDIDNYSVSVQGRKGGHTVYQNNGSQFVVLREGETLSSVAGEFGLSEKKLAKYNDFDAGTQPRPGDMVYIRAKNKRSQNGKLIHIAKDGETLHGISQMYGIRLKNLCSINRRSRDSQVSAGQQIRLM